MKKFVFLFLFFINVFALTFGDYVSFAKYMGYETDYNKALKKAKEKKKDIFVIIIKSGCKYCHKMMDEVLSERGVDRYLSRNFVKLILHREKSAYIPDLLLKRRFTPVSYVVGYKDESIKQMIVGYMEDEQFLWQFKGN